MMPEEGEEGRSGYRFKDSVFRCSVVVIPSLQALFMAMEVSIAAAPSS